jgi:PAS domain-containing protein
VPNKLENRRIDTSDVAVLIVGAQKLVSYANAAAHRLLGRPLGSLQGRPFLELLVDSETADLRGLDEAFRKAPGQRGKARVYGVEGKYEHVQLGFEPFAAPDGSIVAVSVALTPVAAPASKTILGMPFPAERWSEPESGAHQIVAALPVSQTIADVAPIDAPVEKPKTLTKDLQTLANLLRWADHCLSSPIDAAGDLEGVRARARFVLEEAREVLARCRVEIEAV